ncbi:GNAT family N-acetyltransferase [Miltoncostaea marina]|uniref:GNAT family N-acetyltransferase n=1 Tax=Miltoncostaea marina TaxID=2843215 RepID=UPI001C3C477A|nr:GNAT family N-acetyltransferase [Miltoncostaea marina]
MATTQVPGRAGGARDAGDVAATLEPLTAGLEREWDALARRARVSPFLHPGYVRLWRATFGDGTLPSLVAARRGPELVGALPIVRRGGRIAPPGNFETPTVGIVATDAAAARSVAIRVLREGSRRADLLPVTAGSGSHDAFRNAAEELGHRLLTRVNVHCPVVDTADGWDAYWRGRSRNLRHKVERLTRRAREAGTLWIDVRERFDVDELGPLLAEGFAVEGSGWKTAEGTAVAVDPRSRRYYGDLAAWAAREGWLRLTFVRLDGRPIAFGFGVEAHGVHHALKIGYDPAAARLSPGTLLLEALVRRVFEARLARFDFAGHLEPYKAAWATGIEHQLLVTAFPPTPAGRLAHRLERARVALAGSRVAPALRPAAAAARRVAAGLRRDRPAHAGPGGDRE